MTSVELKYRFLLELEAAANAAPGFIDTEIYEFLMKAEKNIISKFIQEKDWNSIFTLLRVSKHDVVADDYAARSFYASLPIDYLAYVSSRIAVSRTLPHIDDTIIIDNYNCEVISRELIDTFTDTTGVNSTIYFKYPKVHLGYGGNKVGIIVDHYTSVPMLTEAFVLNYVKIPVKITSIQTSELPEVLHSSVVSEAVQEAVRSIFVTKVSSQQQQ